MWSGLQTPTSRGMLFWALWPHNPYGYYVLLRWICCAAFAYLVVWSVHGDRTRIGWKKVIKRYSGKQDPAS